jgi:hypothetical protein
MKKLIMGTIGNVIWTYNKIKKIPRYEEFFIYIYYIIYPYLKLDMGVFLSYQDLF